jgi:PEGA domain
MNDSPSMRSAAGYAQVRVREPLGERILGDKVSLGGANPPDADAEVVVPGAAPGPAVTIERRKGIWIVEPCVKGVLFNGRPLVAACDLCRNDTLSIGEAQVVVRDVSRTLLRIDVHHLAGNATIAPAATLATLAYGDSGDDDLEIRAPAGLRVPSLAKAGKRVDTHALPRRPNPRQLLIAAAAVLVLALPLIVTSMLEPVSVDVRPTDARVHTPGTLLAIHDGGRLLLLPGRHSLEAEREGYIAARADIVVGDEAASSVRLYLQKLPGKLHVDTGGIVANVSVDGVAVGHAPGVLSVPAGPRTIIISAPHYLDYIANVTVAGAGERQDLHADLQTSWGTLKILSNPEGGLVSVDGMQGGPAPIAIPAPSGVRRIQIMLSGRKTWQSSVVLKAGETLTVGPVTLGQPDAHLTLRSDPAGADATVAGTHLGRTPVEIDLPAGIAHQVVLSAPGYKNWVRAVFADSGRKISLVARLDPVLARITVQGDPADAELLVDGVARGTAPQSFELPATEHRVEVRKQGFQPFKTLLAPAAGLDRTVQYHLIPVGQPKISG